VSAYRRPPLPELGEEEYQRREARLRPGARERLQVAVAADLERAGAEEELLRARYRAECPGPARAAVLRDLALWHRRRARWLDRFALAEHHLRGCYGREVVDGPEGLSPTAVAVAAEGDAEDRARARRFGHSEEKVAAWERAGRPFGGRY
jgi:hypothetical protein